MMVALLVFHTVPSYSLHFKIECPTQQSPRLEFQNYKVYLSAATLPPKKVSVFVELHGLCVCVCVS